MKRSDLLDSLSLAVAYRENRKLDLSQYMQKFEYTEDRRTEAIHNRIRGRVLNSLLQGYKTEFLVSILEEDIELTPKLEFILATFTRKFIYPV